MKAKTMILVVSVAIIVMVYGAYVLAVLAPIARGDYAAQECFHLAGNGTLEPGC